MRLARFLDSDRQIRIGIESGPNELAALPSPKNKDPSILGFLNSPEHEQTARQALDDRKGNVRNRNGFTRYEINDVTLLPPVNRPSKIICMGGNFVDHLQEGSRSRPDFPISFLKSPTALIGHKANIVYPGKVKLLDYEVELAAIIGRQCSETSTKNALSYIAGYSVFNDVSARDFQFAEMERGFCNIGKNFATFAPMGPFLVTPDQAGNPDDLGMELRVNGRTRQLSNTKNMVFKIRELVEFFSAMTLEPGDIITSGTPSGVAIYRKPDKTPFMLKPGDIIESKIDNLGMLQNSIIAAAATDIDAP
jgi:2-keto-4-pentenoate hydratase/2-oxohepta-3-ene-1,7-dioic acid hydratase in catechol pathway